MNLCVIPARAGSKGLKNKNMRPFLGKPLVRHIIDEALKCDFFDKVVVTTDIEELIEWCNNSGEKRLYPVFRDEPLCKDHVPSSPVVIDALTRVERQTLKIYKNIVTLQATSPLVTHNHIRGAYKRFIDTNADSLLSVKEELHSIWKIEGGVVNPVNYQKVVRQEAHPYYVGNGAIFISKREILLDGDRLGGKIELYPMDWISSWDIHIKEDLEIGEWLKSMRCS